MKYNIRDIGDTGTKVSRYLDAPKVRSLLAQVGAEVTSEDSHAEVDLELRRVDTTVFVSGQITGHFTVACARCLEPATISVEEPELRLTILRLHEPEAEEEELALDDLDTFTHNGKEIDLEPLIREYFILAIPITPLCCPECKGICTKCGVNQNLETCSCSESPNFNTPWAEALKRLKKNSGGSSPGKG